MSELIQSLYTQCIAALTPTLITLNIANVVYVICYLVKDVLLLRILAVLAMLIILPYYWFHHATPSYEPLAWNILFMSINLVWIVLIFRERRKPRLSEMEKDIYEKTFKPICSERDMLRILQSAEWKDFEKGDVIVKANTNPGKLILIRNGSANVVVNGKRMAKLQDGDLTAEMSFLTGNKSVADVVAGSKVQAVVWRSVVLRKVFESRPELKTGIYQLIGHDLIAKLDSTQSRVPELSISISSTGALRDDD